MTLTTNASERVVSMIFSKEGHPILHNNGHNTAIITTTSGQNLLSHSEQMWHRIGNEEIEKNLKGRKA